MLKAVKYILILFLFQIVYLNFHSHKIDFISIHCFNKEIEINECEICDFINFKEKYFTKNESIIFNLSSLNEFRILEINIYSFLKTNFNSLRAPPVIS